MKHRKAFPREIHIKYICMNEMARGEWKRYQLHISHLKRKGSSKEFSTFNILPCCNRYENPLTVTKQGSPEPNIAQNSTISYILYVI